MRIHQSLSGVRPRSKTMKTKKTKPTPAHWLFTLYWWNPFVYFMILMQFFHDVWFYGLKEFFHDVWVLISEYDWM